MGLIMAKKKIGKREMSDELLASFQGAPLNDGTHAMSNRDGIRDIQSGCFSSDEKQNIEAMFLLALSGITPEEYARFYQIFQLSGSIADSLYDDADIEEFRGFGRRRCDIKEYEVLDNASEQTLVLKIQMKDVSKPPMWREVEIPADFNFLQLHEVIQEVVGLEDCHLWQFNKKGYDDSLQIGVEMDKDNPYGPGLDYVTHEADATEVTRFLQQKGDKLEYIYDFGDDWIFSVEVKELCAKKIEHPVCRKYKGELNVIEDSGGVGSYLEARENLETWGQMTEKKKKMRSEAYGFESEDEYLDFLNSHRFSLEDVNEMLGMIH